MAERNIDFNEAKKLGLVAPNKRAEAEVLKSAGGADAFKPQSWWSDQLSSQVNKAKFEEKTGSKLQVRDRGITGIGSERFVDASPMMGNTPPRSTWGEQPVEGVDYRYVDVLKDVTSSVLKKITAQSKKQVQNLQRQSGEISSRSRRLARSTGGLLAGSATPEASSLSKGPQLGGDDELSNGSMLGGRRRT
jgi:hypothetical protein